MKSTLNIHWKDWCFWNVVLEKTPESPLDCKEIKPVKPKWNQPWIFIGRVDADVPILLPCDAKNQLIEKDPDAGEDWRQEKRMTEDEMAGWHHWLNGRESEWTPQEVPQKTKIMASGPITSWQIDGQTMETVTDFIFWGSKITMDSDCSHKIKRHLPLGRKTTINLDSIVKSRDITLPTKVHTVKALLFQ